MISGPMSVQTRSIPPAWVFFDLTGHCQESVISRCVAIFALAATRLSPLARCAIPRKGVRRWYMKPKGHVPCLNLKFLAKTYGESVSGIMCSCTPKAFHHQMLRSYYTRIFGQLMFEFWLHYREKSENRGMNERFVHGFMCEDQMGYLKRASLG